MADTAAGNELTVSTMIVMLADTVNPWECRGIHSRSPPFVNNPILS